MVNHSSWFQSVDPMSDKYPSLSAYNYCAWNPVMLVDPDGREVDPAMSDNVRNRIDPNHKDYNAAFHELYKKLDADKGAIFKFNEVKADKKGGATVYGTVTCEGLNSDGKEVININYSFGEGVRSKDNALLEEAFHATQFLDGAFGFQNDGNGNWNAFGIDLYDEAQAKVFAATHTTGVKTIDENRLLKAHASAPESLKGAMSYLSNQVGYENMSGRMNVIESIRSKPENSRFNASNLFNENGRSRFPTHIMRMP